jgi:hypothetical protein
LALTFTNEKSMPVSAAFLDSKTAFLGVYRFNVPIELSNTTSDYVRLTVNDNLTSVDFLAMQYRAYRFI